MDVIKHETKQCPRCSAVFECKMGSIAQCQCYPVLLTEAHRYNIGRKYDDCLCATCLEAIKVETEQVKAS